MAKPCPNDRDRGLMLSERGVSMAHRGLIVSCICVFSCLAASSQEPSAPSTGTTQASGTQPPTLQERHPRYRVMPSDVLAISFPLSPEINQSVTVQPDGFITLANVGSIYVEGQTTPEIVETLKRAYSQTLHNPIIGVDPTNFQAPEFTILGQIGKPGKYPLRRDTTISEGIAIGGGFLSSAKSQVFLLHRISPD